MAFVAPIHRVNAPVRGGARVPVPLEAPLVVSLTPARRAVVPTGIPAPETRPRRVRAETGVAGPEGVEGGAPRPAARKEREPARTAAADTDTASGAEAEGARARQVASAATVGGVRQLLAVPAPWMRPLPVAGRDATTGGVAA